MIDLWDMAKSANFTEKELESFRVRTAPGDAGARRPGAPSQPGAGVAGLLPAVRSTDGVLTGSAPCCCPGSLRRAGRWPCETATLASVDSAGLQ